MATVIDTPPIPSPHSKHDQRLRAELDKVAKRIQLNDLLVGALTLTLSALAYAVLAILIDRWLVLPEWVRQLGLLGYGVIALTIVYRYLIRPFRRSVNIRYAARQLESTFDNSKNAVINWVDLQDDALPEGVRRAVSLKASEGVAHSDRAKASESRSLLWLGGIVGLLVATLALLFILLKPAPFFSLLGRAFNPFTPQAIATRTLIRLTEPQTGDATVVAGETFVVGVFVEGSLPDPNSPDRVRLQVRYNAESPAFDELPLEPGSSNREWQLRVPQSVIQNGFWYRVVGGDGATAEHRLTVQSQALVKAFQVRYEYPAYTRIAVEESHDPRIEAYRGTTVTVTVRTNRTVKSGWLQERSAQGQPMTHTGEVVGTERDSLQVRFPLTQSGTYVVGFISTADEISEPTVPLPITVLNDQAPNPTITTPTDEQINLPANGLLAVDGIVGDDFGISGVKLVIRIQGDSKPLLEVPFRKGASLQRESDHTFPTTIEYKDSVPLATLNPDPKATNLGLAPDTVLEYWLEAKDNCVPNANIGKSKIQTVKLGPPETEESKKAEMKKQQDQRRQAEKQHEAKQDQQLQEEKRDPKQLHPDEKEPEQGQPQPGAEGQAQDGANAKPQEGQPQEGADAKQQEGGTEGNPMPNPNGQPGTSKENPSNTDASKPPPNMDPNLDQKAKEIENALKEQNQPGQARNEGPKPNQPEMPPSETKPEPKEQPEAKTGEPSKTGDDTTATADPKGAGRPQPGAESSPATEKERPKTEPTPSKTAQPNGDAQSTPPDKPAETKSATGPGTEQEPESKPAPKNGEGSQPQSTPSNTKDQGNTQPKDMGTEGAKPGSEKSAQPNPQNGTDSQKMNRSELEQALDDLGSDDEQRRQAARDKLDEQVGKENRQKAEQIAKDRNSPNPETRNKAKQEAGELSRELGGDGEAAPTPKDEKVERLLRDKAKDLNSPDENTRRNAEKQVDDAVGREARDELQKAAKNLDSPKPEERQKAQDDVDELAKKKSREKKKEQDNADSTSQPMNQDGANGSPSDRKLSPEQAAELAKKAGDLNSPDADKRKAAEKEFDNAVGKENREQLQKDLAKNGNGNAEQTAREQLDKLSKQQQNQSAGSGKPNPKEPTPEQKQQAAEQIEQLKKDAEDLASKDENKRKAAEKKFDDLIGKDNREQLQQNAHDLKSGDPQRQQAAKDRIQQMAKEHAKEAQNAGQQPNPKEPTPEQKQQAAEQIEQLKKDAEDLNSTDEAKRQAAEKKFDQALGQEKREQLQKDLASNDPDKKQNAKDALEQMAGKGGNQPQQPNPKEPTPEQKQQAAEQIEQLKKDAEDLASKDEAKRKAAEKKFDDLIGKDNREQLQQNAQDLKSGDPQRQQAAKDRIQQMAKDLQQQDGNDRAKDWKPGGLNNGGPDEILHKDDPRNRLKSAELQLKTFEKNKANEDLLKKLNYTPEEYEQFLEGYRRRVETLREEVAKADSKTTPKPTGPATIRVGEGSDAKLDTRPDIAAGANGSSGAGTAPPGFSAAQRKFAEAAAKQKAK